MSWVALWQIQHSIFPNPIGQCDSLGDIEYLDYNMRHGSLVDGKAMAYTAIYWKFRCTGESSAYVLRPIMTNPAQYICQSHLAIRHSRRYWVPGSEYKTQLADVCLGRSFWWHTIKFLVQLGVLSIYYHDQSITAYWPIPVVNLANLGDIEYLGEKMRHGLTFCWQSCCFCWPMIEVLVHWRIMGISLWQIQHRILPNPIGQ